MHSIFRLENHHRAVDDAGATAEIFVKFVEMLKDRGIYDLAKLNQFGENNADAVRKLPSYHVIILALNEVGRVNLYNPDLNVPSEILCKKTKNSKERTVEIQRRTSGGKCL